MVRGVISSDHVIVVLCPADGSGPTPVLAWPDPVEQDQSLARSPFLEAARSSGTAVIDANQVYIPFGTTQAGAVVMVVHHPKEPGVTAAAVRGAALELVAAFAANANRSSMVAGLEHQRNTDPLTGLSNRRELLSRMEQEMQHSSRNGTPLAVAMVDLDHFKRYNDMHGHGGGDTLLKAVSQMMRETVRSGDLVARFGGEEFVVVLPATDLTGAYALLERLRVNAHGVNGGQSVTFSIGATVWNGVESPHEMIARADAAIYSAKNGGRDRVVCAALAA
jgi:diguanylate cyclase (GGDEF)-like protein